MNRVVLDASVMLSLIFREPGAEVLTPRLLADAVGSAVNITEAQSKLIRLGWAADQAWEDCVATVQEIVPFDAEQARTAGGLTFHTQHLGLSLGDRACLGLGLLLQAPVYTAERLWKQLRLQVKVHVIR
jgi:ribonuclease VapC